MRCINCDEPVEIVTIDGQRAVRHTHGEYNCIPGRVGGPFADLGECIDMPDLLQGAP